MIENLYEQCVYNKNPKPILFILGTIASLVSYALSLLVVAVGLKTDWQTMLYALILIPLGWYLWKKRDEAYLEYEYCFVAGQIDIDLVINNKRRRKLITFETASLDVFGKVSSPNFNRYYLMPGVKKIKACFDFSSSNTYFTMISTPKGKYVLLFQPDDTMISYMKHHLKVKIEQ